MKSKISAVLLLCAVSIGPALAQTPKTNTPPPIIIPIIFGHGTPNYIPRFVGPTKIGDSSFFQSSDGNIGLGTTTPNGTLSVFNPSPIQFNGEGPFAVYARVENPINSSAAVRGDALATDGGASGVIGITYGGANGVLGVSLNPDGRGFGVEGTNELTLAGGGGGVYGHTSATSGFSVGVRAETYASTGGATALFALSHSPEAATTYILNTAGGDILVGAVGNNTSVFRVDGNGHVYANGGFQPNGADFAESMAVAGSSNKYAPGDLLVIDPTGNRRLAIAQEAYSTLVAGIYSTKPGMLGSTHKIDEQSATPEVPLAVVGIVPCKVSTENGAIQAGDLLVTSSTPGHAMKGTDRSRMLGAVVGKALEPLQEGTGVIQVLVTLQ